MGTLPGAGDVARPMAQAQLVRKLGASGVPAPAVIDALLPTPQPDIRGGQRVEVRVTITPIGGQPYQATIMQSFLPSQMEDLSPGKTIGVRYDPDEPTAALISTW
ncbi:MAG TPA: hypothetical protein VE983_07675 [Solirubrobacteraceae bacterium]|nr:hypothetical protein [Solirubrobacteraceae bacterium]